MAEINLSQSEADALIKMEKHKVNDQKWLFPSDGIIAIPLVSANKREDFILASKLQESDDAVYLKPKESVNFSPQPTHSCLDRMW